MCCIFSRNYLWSVQHVGYRQLRLAIQRRVARLDEYFTVVDRTEKIKKAYALEMQVRCMLKAIPCTLSQQECVAPFQVITCCQYIQLCIALKRSWRHMLLQCKLHACMLKAIPCTLSHHKCVECFQESTCGQYSNAHYVGRRMWPRLPIRAARLGEYFTIVDRNWSDHEGICSWDVG